MLELYPEPNVDAGGWYNYQTTTLSATNVDNFQSRVNHGISNRDSVLVTATYQRTNTEAVNVFGFRRLQHDIESRHRRQLVAPVQPVLHGANGISVPSSDRSTRRRYFANRANISGEAGITGNNQEPMNWGPPSLIFSSGVAGLSTGQYPRQNGQTHGFSTEALWRTRGGHNFTFGGAVRPQTVDVVGQQNPRGTFGFDGSITGSDFADFLLGVPQFGGARVRQRRQTAARHFDARVPDRRLAGQSDRDLELRPSVGIRVAVHGVSWPPRESRRRSGLHDGDARRGRRASGRQGRHSAPRRRGASTHPGIVARDSRRIRHLSQHGGLSVDRDAAGAAAAVVADVERREHARRSR